MRILFQVCVTLFGLALLCDVGVAQVKDAFAGVQIGDSAAEVRRKLTGKCSRIENESFDPSFPLSKESEIHLVCRKFSHNGLELAAVAFVVADDAVVMISARGGAYDTLSQKANTKESSYLGYRLFPEELAFALKSTDTFTLISKDALHPNLFVWENPFLSKSLDQDGAGTGGYRKSASRPPFVKFGSDLSELKPMIDKECPLVQVDKIEKPWLPSKPREQVQINCFGYEYAGFPRKLELVFGDGVLELVWILTAKPEEGRVRKSLEKAFGKPVLTNGKWEAYKGWTTFLRKDKPEVLMISEGLIDFFTPHVKGTKDSS